jgi:hypothetical protein
MHSADAGSEWSPAFCDVDRPNCPWLFKAIVVHDVTVCLDESES